MTIARNCIFCGKEFVRQLSPDNLKRGKGKYCSPECGAKQSQQDYHEGKSRYNLSGLQIGRGLMRGKHYPFNHPIREKIARSLRGKLGPESRNWRGGLTEACSIIRHGQEHKQWGHEVFKRDNFECQICGTKRGPLQAHHIKRFIDYLDLRFDINNGITLCKKCHTLVTWHEKDWESYFNFNLSIHNL